MANVTENRSLKRLNTFGFDAKARYFAALNSLNEIRDILEEFNSYDLPLYILGGGSNVIFSGDYEGLILHPQIKGLSIVDENERYVWLKVGAGIVWDDFVNYATENNLCGVENLSAIPGNVGAAPVQNIGAYGMEVKDSIYAVNGIFISDCSNFELRNEECKFGYRDSVFKNELKQRAIVTSVIFRLSKIQEYTLDYGDVKKKLKEYNEINLRNIRDAIIKIRAEKLPNPKELGNAGSFFKNPVVETKAAQKMLKLYPSMPTYPFKGKVKLSAAWLIEKCNLKGYRLGNVGVHQNQALVLVHYGQGNVNELLELSRMIQNTV
ncbi:MAG: UDP-N-acetylmuramate dehydrogenase, partial [Prevotellaceae bacterium]|nr:UDP-N-acetylmuramate dehydrogenase [Prevotellaceae bacterium]